MKREILLICLLFVLISLAFFHPIFKGFIPFPGDLLVGEYSPYSSYSFFGYAPHGFPNKGQDFDVLRLLYPAKEFSINSFKNLDLPFWNPYNFSGNPHLASLQSGSFYPLNIIFWLFPFISAWTAYIVTQPILAAIFTYFLLRELRLGIKSSIFGALSFAFSSYQVVWMEYGNIGHSILWLPLAMWLSLKNIRQPSLLNSIVLILALTSSILAGYLQDTFYLYIFLFAFIVFNIIVGNKNRLLTKLAGFIPIFILPILLSAIQLLPTIELFFHSARSSYTLSSFLKLLIPSVHLATAFVPDFFGNPATRNYWLSGTYIERVSYIGVLPLFFAVYGIIKKRTHLIWFFIISMSFVYLITFDSIFSRILYSIFLPPFISTAVPSRIMFIFCFSASLLAAYGFDYLQKDKISKKFWVSMLMIACVYLFLWVFVIAWPAIFKSQSWNQNLNISMRNLVIPTVIFLLGATIIYLSFKLKSFKQHLLAAAILLTIFDLFYFFNKITPFSPKESIYPKTEVIEYLKTRQGIDRSWGYGSGYIEANIQTHENIFSTNGYDALHIKRYGEMLTASKNGKILKLIPGADANIASGYGENDLKNNYYRQQFLNLLGVKYVLHKINPDRKPFLSDTQTFPEATYRLIWQKGGWQIYENKKVMPRFFLASNYVIEKDRQKIINRILDENFDMRETLVLEESISPKHNLKKDSKANVKMVSFAPNKIILTTSAATDMLLFLSDNYYPGWKVSIDGENDKIYRADYSFRAVPVTQGKHQVVFSYYPWSFAWGLKISSITVLSIVFFIIFKRFTKHNV